MKRTRPKRARKRTVATLERALRRERSLRKAWQAAWHERCPKGHLVRYDECDLVGCYITVIDKWPTWFSITLKTPSPGTVHEWTTRVPNDLGWWWRVPYGWMLTAWRRIRGTKEG